MTTKVTRPASRLRAELENSLAAFAPADVAPLLARFPRKRKQKAPP